MTPLEMLLRQIDEDLQEKRAEHRLVTDQLVLLERKRATVVELIGESDGSS